jgi:archaellum component FlaC
MSEAIITGVVGVIVAYLTHLITKRKYTSEVENSNIKNMQDSLDFYKDLSDDQHIRMNSFLDQNEGLVHKIEKLEQEVKELKAVVENQEVLKQESSYLKLENENLRAENQTLRLQVETLLNEKSAELKRKSKKKQVRVDAE